MLWPDHVFEVFEFYNGYAMLMVIELVTFQPCIKTKNQKNWYNNKTDKSQKRAFDVIT